jgi:hypothetical protein
MLPNRSFSAGDMIERHTITVTTAGSGAFTGFSPLSARGQIRQVCYTPDTSTPLDTNTNINLTGAYLNCSEQCFDARSPACSFSAPRWQKAARWRAERRGKKKPRIVGGA